jgi:hypothetical protein
MKLHCIKVCVCASLLLVLGLAQAEGFRHQSKRYASSNPSGAKPVDPSKFSSGDKHYIYWAANSHVFQIPFNSAEPIYPIAEIDITGIHLKAKREIPAPPDTNEPEGCYSNPLRGLSMPYVKNFEARLYEELFRRPYNVGAQGNGVYAVPLSYQNVHQRVNRLSVSKRKACWNRNEDLRECVAAGQEQNDYSSAHIFTLTSARQKQLGIGEIHFSVQYGLSPSNATVTVKSDFLLFESVRVSLNPEIYPNELDLMNVYHQKIIEFIAGSYLPTYRWNQAERK